MSRKQNNEYMRVYMLDRYHKRRAKALEDLGGACVKCGTNIGLQFDHIDPDSKSFTLGAALATWSEERVQDELLKCQLLCAKCHENKTLSDLGQESAKDRHGTTSTYRYCKCDLCRAAWNAYCREYKRKARKAKKQEEE